MKEANPWPSRLIWAVLLTFWISGPYYLLQRFALFPVHVLHPSAFDRAIPFVPAMAWPYLSLYLLVAVPGLLLKRQRDIRRFVAGFFLLGLASNLVFLLWPNRRIQRPESASQDRSYRLVVSVDRTGNACPSLHASMAVYTALWSTRLLRRRRALLGAWQSAGFIWIWTFLILYATIATRQHVGIDLIAGGGLAVFLFCVGRAFRGLPSLKKRNHETNEKHERKKEKCHG